MAKYILLAVESDDVADKLMAKLAPLTVKGVHLAGLFQWPRNYCKCGPFSSERVMVNEVKRGAKFGWWTHITCRKPRRGPQSPKNLLGNHDFGPYLSLTKKGKPIKNFPITEGYDR